MSKGKKYVLLSFDVEEFDMPLEYGQQIPIDEQMETGYKGLEVLMELLQPFQINGTFFTTAHFAGRYPAAIREIASEHEIASHTFYHSHFDKPDLLSSRLALEEISGQRVTGLRMPRMRKVDMKDVKEAGYAYDSSVNPTWLPGRYNNLGLPRTQYVEEGMTRLPASVSPHLRIPLFWLSFKNFPYSFFLRLARQTLAKDGYLCLYFHPWEFIPLDQYKIPGYAKKGAGVVLQEKLKRLVRDLQQEGEFISIQNYLSLAR